MSHKTPKLVATPQTNTQASFCNTLVPCIHYSDNQLSIHWVKGVMYVFVHTTSLSLPCHSCSITTHAATGLILALPPTNERWCYFVRMSLLGWVQAENQPCGISIILQFRVKTSYSFFCHCQLQWIGWSLNCMAQTLAFLHWKYVVRVSIHGWISAKQTWLLLWVQLISDHV